MTPRLIAGAAEQAGFLMFASALRSTQHIRAVEGAGPFTVFAPIDAAFGKFSRAALDQSLDGDEKLRELVIGYHIANGKVVTAQFAAKGIRAVVRSGGKVFIDGRTELRVNGAAVVQGHIAANNGIIHGIDTVLWPREPVQIAGMT